MNGKRRCQGWTVWIAWMALVGIVVGSHGCATTPVPRGPDVRSPIPGQTAAGTPEPSPTPGPAPVSPVPGTPVGTTASGGQITSNAPDPAVVDTLPTSEAQSVLGTIPEPLPPGERVPPPEGEEEGPAETGEGDVPVPAPTQPLGERPPPSSDTTGSSSAAPPPAQPAPPAPPTGSAASDSCFRVQLAAVPEPERAAALREGAQSQLQIPIVIETESGLHKVRSRDCTGSAAADRLRRRAEDAGFTGAFRFRPKR